MRVLEIGFRRDKEIPVRRQKLRKPFQRFIRSTKMLKNFNTRDEVRVAHGLGDLAPIAQNALASLNGLRKRLIAKCVKTSSVQTADQCAGTATVVENHIFMVQVYSGYS